METYGCLSGLKRHSTRMTHMAREGGRLTSSHSAYFGKERWTWKVIYENHKHSLTLAGGIQSCVLVGLVNVDEGEVITFRM